MSSKACAIDGCVKTRYYSKDWCLMHYRRWQRNGDPEARATFRGDPAGSLAARTRAEGDCLVWTGARSKDGYGLMKTGGKTRQTHVVAYVLANGEPPQGMQVDHICWNRACVNVAHLRLATRNENQWNRSAASAASGYRNVYPARGGGFYVQIRHNYKKMSFGTYATAEEAAVVAKRERERLFGDYAGRY